MTFDQRMRDELVVLLKRDYGDVRVETLKKMVANFSPKQLKKDLKQMRAVMARRDAADKREDETS